MGIGRFVNALPSPLLVVTDRHQAQRPLEDIVSRARAAGARWFWLRDRDLARNERRQLACRLADIVHGAGGRLSIGDDVELAAEIGSSAVHMRDLAGIVHARDTLGPSALIGLSAHNIADVANAKIAGADYVTLSPIHQSASKPDYGPALGVTAIARGTDRHSCPRARRYHCGECRGRNRGWRRGHRCHGRRHARGRSNADNPVAAGRVRHRTRTHMYLTWQPAPKWAQRLFARHLSTTIL